MTNYRVADYNSITDSKIFGEGSKINYQCYSQIPKYKNLIAAYSTKTECYIHEDSLDIHMYETTIPRCGQCLQLFSSSGNSMICMIAGSYSVNKTINENSGYERTLLISTKSMHYLNNQLEDIKIQLITQVTLRFIDCSFYTIPQLYVTGEDNNSLFLIPFNMNVMINFIRVDKVNYHFNSDHSIHIPKTVSTTPHEYQLIGINLDVVKLYVPFFSVNKTYEAMTPFGKNTFSNTDCLYIPNSILYNYSYVYPDSYFTYSTKRIYEDNIIQPHDLINGKLKYVSSYNTFGVGFKYPNSFKIESLYKSVYLIVESTDPDFEIINILCHNLHYKRNAILTHIADFIFFTVHMKKSNLLEVIHVELLQNDYLNNVIECDINSFYCNNVECNPSGSTIESNNSHSWKDGCVPPCGSCLTGFSCDKSGKCVVTPNYNIRSGCVCIQVILTLLMIIII
ncbi:Uncharacterized protein QTN25_001408 [Entamoeba marina]